MLLRCIEVEHSVTLKYSTTSYFAFNFCKTTPNPKYFKLLFFILFWASCVCLSRASLLKEMLQSSTIPQRMQLLIYTEAHNLLYYFQIVFIHIHNWARGVTDELWFNKMQHIFNIHLAGHYWSPGAQKKKSKNWSITKLQSGCFWWMAWCLSTSLFMSSSIWTTTSQTLLPAFADQKPAFYPKNLPFPPCLFHLLSTGCVHSCRGIHLPIFIGHVPDLHGSPGIELRQWSRLHLHLNSHQWLFLLAWKSHSNDDISFSLLALFLKLPFLPFFYI